MVQKMDNPHGQGGGSLQRLVLGGGRNPIQEERARGGLESVSNQQAGQRGPLARNAKDRPGREVAWEPCPLTPVVC